MIMLVKDIIQEYSVRNKEKKDYPVYSVTNSQGFCKDYFGKEVASKDKSTYKIVPYGCFAYNPSRINVGSIDWQHCENFVIVSPLYNVFTVNTNITRQDYLSYYFKSRLVSDYINTFAKGSVRLNVPLSTLGSFPVPIPPLAEQERIVAELDLLSSIIDKKKAQLKELDQLAQSIFYTMFGDPITNEKGWEVKKLGDVYKMKSGDGLSAKQFVDGPYPVYGGNGISGYHNNYNKDGNYIIIGRVGAYCGNVRYVEGKFWLTDNAFQLFYDSSKQLPVFVTHFLTHLNLHRFANQAAQPVISNITLKDIKVLFPPLPLQQEFASKIEAIERQKSLIQQSIVETQTLFDSRMDHWFG